MIELRHGSLFDLRHGSYPPPGGSEDSNKENNKTAARRLFLCVFRGLCCKVRTVDFTQSI